MNRLLAILVTALLVSSPATAATLFAGPIQVGGRDTGSFVLQCSLVHFGKRDLSDVEVIANVENDGTMGNSAASLAPETSLVVARANTNVTSDVGWCTFTFKGGKRAVRATACVVGPEDNCEGTVEAR